MRWVGWAGILAAAGLGGCLGILGFDDRPSVLVRFALQVGSGNTVTLHTDVGGRRFSLSDQGPGDKPTFRNVPVPRTGTLPVRVAALLPGTDTLASAEFTAEYLEGHVHWITVEIGRHRPNEPCQRTVAAVPTSAPIRRDGSSTTDTLFVLAGSMPRDRTCSAVNAPSTSTSGLQSPPPANAARAAGSV